MISKNAVFFSERLKFNGIEEKDAENLVKWRSDKNIIKFFLNPNPITMERHLDWFNNYKKSNTRYDFIIRIKNHNTPIGVVGISNINSKNNSCEINYAIGESAYHNKGYASEAVISLINFSIKSLNIKSFLAEIHEDNLASANLIKKIGFVETSSKGCFKIFEKKINSLYFRVDGNEKIGTGHTMRCLSIAEAARNKGIRCIFIVSDNKMTALIENKGFKFIIINSVWNNLDEEIDLMCNLIDKEQIDKLIIDSYFVTQKYIDKLFLKTEVIYIDDLFKSVFSCHTVINYNCYANSMPYKESYLKTQLLLGTEYAPLRKEFVNPPVYKIKNKVVKILITTGGTDLYNAASKITKKLSPLINKEIQIYIISGRFNEYINDLESIENSDNRVKVYTNVKKMSDLILQCDVAISAGGSTLYELCACGIPTVMFVMADNQLHAYESITKELMLDGGNMLVDENMCTNGIVNCVMNLINDTTLRQSLSRKMQIAVDGNGAVRIVNKIFNI